MTFVVGGSEKEASTTRDLHRGKFLFTSDVPSNCALDTYSR